MRRRTIGKQLRFEALEAKRPLASNVTAVEVGGDLIITGDMDANLIRAEPGDNVGEIKLTSPFIDSTTMTTINGMVMDTIPGITGGIFASFGDGRDGFTLDGLEILTLSGDVSVDLGTSDAETGFAESVSIRNIEVLGNISIDATQAGGSISTIEGVELAGDLSISGSAATDRLSIGANAANSFGDDVVLDLGDSPIGGIADGGDFLDSTIDDDFIVTLGDTGSTELTIEAVFVGDDLQVVAGAGAATLAAADLHVNDDLMISASSGAISLSGDPLTVTVGDDMSVVGDNNGIDVHISGISVGDDVIVVGGSGDLQKITVVNVTVGDDLKISASSGPVTVAANGTNVSDDLVIVSDNSGVDLTVEGLSIGDDVLAIGGSGNDVIILGLLLIGDDLRLLAQGGDDEVLIGDSVIDGAALVSLGHGEDDLEITGLNERGDEDADELGYGLTVLGHGSNSIFIEDVTTTHFINIVTASGADIIAMANLLTHSALITTGAGDDELTISESQFDYLFALMGSGDDCITLGGVTVNRWAFLNGGGGEDALVMDANQEMAVEDSLWDVGFELDECPEVA